MQPRNNPKKSKTSAGPTVNIITNSAYAYCTPMMDNLRIGFLNTFNRPSALESALSFMTIKDNWILGVNEINTRSLGENLLEEAEGIFTSKHTGRAVIMCSEDEWIEIWSPTHYDVISIRRHTVQRDIIITCLYLSPSLEKKTTEKIVEAIHDMIRQHRSSQHILMGDVNCRSSLWGSPKEDVFGTKLANSLLHLEFGNPFLGLKDSWTHAPMGKFSESKSWIDLILVNNKLDRLTRNAKVVNIPESDHRMLMFDLRMTSISKSKTNKKTLTKELVKLDLSYLNRDIIESSIAEDGCMRLELGMKKSFEIASIQRTFKKNQLNPKVVRARRAIQRKLRRVKRKLSNMEEDPLREEIHRAKKDLEHEARIESKRLSIQKKKIKKKRIEHMIKKNGRWWIIKKIIGTHFVRSCKNDCVYKHEEVILNEQFERLASEFTDEPIWNEKNVETHKGWNVKLTEPEIRRILKGIGKKPCNYDRGLSCTILSELLKYQGNIILGFVENCINRFLIPVNIKKAKVKLIPKSEPGKFRPLSILHPIFRLFEITAHTILKRFIDFSKLKRQLGFKQATGIADLHQELKIAIEKHKANHPNLPLLMVCLDLSTAFDKISKAAILEGERKIGLPLEALKLTAAILNDRQSYILVNGTRRWMTHRCGTP